MDWRTKRVSAAAEHAARSARAPDTGEREDFALARIAGASWAEGLAALMDGDPMDARRLLARAADEYRASWAVAPPGSWGRPIAAIRCRLMADDTVGLELDAAATLAEEPTTAAGPIAAYAATLALLALGRDADALPIARSLQEQEEASFVRPVADALTSIASGDGPGYAVATAAVIDSFESRDAFLEDLPVADTVLALDGLARDRGLPRGPPTDRVPARLPGVAY